MPRFARTLILLAAVLSPSPAAAQWLLDRPPNLSGGWVAPLGVVQFDFLHRFVRSPAPQRKVTGFPTFFVGAGLPAQTMVGFLYSTNSTLVPNYPNEWEFFGRILPLAESHGAPLDLGAQAGYNLAADGFDGELSLARRVGPVRLLGVARVLASLDSGGADVALGGGAAVRVLRFLSLTGDVVSLTHRNQAAGEKVAWSAGIHALIPNTPHTLSVQATNTNTATLQGASRGTDRTRYGFAFTIPFTLSRYFGHRQTPPVRAAGDTTAPGGRVAAVRMQGIAFGPNRLEVAVGTTVIWTNRDALEHSVTANDGSFDSGLIQPGTTWRHSFTAPGTYTYYCIPHPFMHGVIIVKEVE